MSQGGSVEVLTTEQGFACPLPFLSASLGDHQVLHRPKSWGLYFCHQEGMTYVVLLGKKEPGKHHDVFIRRIQVGCVFVSHWVCTHVVWET